MKKLSKKQRNKRKVKNKTKSKNNNNNKNGIVTLVFIILGLIILVAIWVGNIKAHIWPDILVSIISISLSAYLSTLQILSKRLKVIIIIVCVAVTLHTVYKTIDKHSKNERDARTKEYFYQSQERAELYGKGLSDEDVWKYDKDPLLKHYLQEADQNMKTGKFNVAINKYKNCLQHRNISIETQHWTNGNVAKCYVGLGDFNKASKYWNKALIIAEKIDDKMVRTWFVGRSYGGLGHISFSEKKYEQALNWFQKSHKEFDDGGAITGTAASLYNIGLTHSMMNQFNQALESYKHCIEFSTKHKDDRVVASSLCNIGMILWDSRKAKYEQVLDYCNKAFNLAVTIRDTSCILRATNFAAHLSFKNKQLEKSIEYNKKYIGYSKNKLNINVGVAMAIVARSYFFSGEFELALNYYKQARDVFEKIGHFEFCAESLQNAGVVCTFMRKDSCALKYWQEALDICRKNNYKNFEKSLLISIKTLKNNE